MGHIQQIPLTDEVRSVMERVQGAGGRAFVVGGAIRDWVWQPTTLDPSEIDWDLACDLSLEELNRLAVSHHPGERYGTSRLGTRMGATAIRRDGPSRDRRHPEHVAAASPIDEDLARRDFTVNAAAFDGQSVYWVSGAADDFAARRLRTVGDARSRFHEDPLRMLRLVRFKALYDAAVDPEASRTLHDLLPLAFSVSRERRLKEFLRFLKSPPSRWHCWGEAGLDAVMEFPGTAREVSAADNADVPEHPAAAMALYMLFTRHSLAGLGAWAQSWPLPRSWRSALVRAEAVSPTWDLDDWTCRARQPDERARWLFSALARAAGVLGELEPPPRVLSAQELMDRFQVKGPALGMLLRRLSFAAARDPALTREQLLALAEEYLRSN